LLGVARRHLARLFGRRAHGAEGGGRVQRESHPRLTEPRLGPAWLAQPERSNAGVIRVFAWIALRLGRRVARLLLHPITIYFLLFSVDARAASREYLRRVLDREPRFADVYRHYHTFAATILDRVYLLKDRFAGFDVRTVDEQIVRGMIFRGEGGFLLGAHLGSFEVIRSLGREARGLKVRMVMYEENAKKLNGVLDAINPALAQDVIGLGKLDSMLKVERALESGEFVGMLADRTIRGEGTMDVTFLGAPARIPVGPFRIAAIMKRPVVLIFGLYRGGKRYDIYFERLVDMSVVDRGSRDAVIEQAVRQYVERLEHYCRLAPYNWFNFYDYWH
jgi:predicted LPLAT superfamily acyltransferase